MCIVLVFLKAKELYFSISSNKEGPNELNLMKFVDKLGELCISVSYRACTRIFGSTPGSTPAID